MRRAKVVNSSLEEQAAVEAAIKTSSEKKAAAGAATGAFFSVSVHLCLTHLPPLSCSVLSSLPTDTTGVRFPALCFARTFAPTSITTNPSTLPPSTSHTHFPWLLQGLLQSKIRTSPFYKDTYKPTVGLACDGVFVTYCTVCEEGGKGRGSWALIIGSPERKSLKEHGIDLSASVKTGARTFIVPLVATRIVAGKGKAASNFSFAINKNPPRFAGQGNEEKLKFVKRLTIVSQVGQSSSTAMQVEDGDGDSL